MSVLNKCSAALLFWMLMGLLCHAQTIKGNIVDSLNKAVPFAGVNLKSANNIIIAYTTSNEKGVYTLQIPADADKAKLQIEVSCVGFRKESQAVNNLATAYNFKLHPASHQLKTVVIKDKNPRLRVIGDTLSYKVSDFSNAQDRVIGDVIKKLPGIDVDKNGKISYNGKSISNLYIGGDNLLDDKYNIATNSIPHGVVDQVQVMQNHQPVKMLQNKVVSDDVALNLTIKKDAKVQLVGTETIGAGLPGNYYADLNAIALNDKYKAINYIKGNNIGTDVSTDLIAHNESDFLSRVDNDKPATILSLGTAGDPDLLRNRYLFNRSGLLNLNNLINLKKDVQLRANLSYLRDDQRKDYRKVSEIYLPNDTVRFVETQRNTFRPDILHAQFLLNINKSKFYLNNNFSTDYSHKSNYSALITNSVPLNQNLSDNLTNISNELSFMKTLKGNNILEVYSYLNHSTEPENRVIEPNLNPAIFNNGINYNLLTQTANMPTWFTNNYLSCKIPGDIIAQSYKAGFTDQSQKLTSALNVTQLNNNYNLAADSAQNSLNWSRQKAYAQADYDLPGKIWKVNVSLPLSLQNVNYSDNFYHLDKNLTRLYFDPSFLVKYQVSVENFFSANYRFKNSVGNIQDVYRGEILTNYRSLLANNADLTERQTQSGSLGFNYRKAITLFFFSINGGFTHQYANTISSSIVTSNLTQRIVLPFENNINSWVLNGNISKYNFDLRTTFSAQVNYQTTKLNQIQNNIILPYITKTTTVAVAADTKVSTKVNFNYKAVYTSTQSNSSVVVNSSKFESLIQSGSVNYNPLPWLITTISGDYYYTNQQNGNSLKYAFADASIRCIVPKSKLSFELTGQNLLNTKNYTAVYLAANVYTASNYTIPGRIILAKAMFNL